LRRRLPLRGVLAGGEAPNAFQGERKIDGFKRRNLSPWPHRIPLFLSGVNEDICKKGLSTATGSSIRGEGEERRPNAPENGREKIRSGLRGLGRWVKKRIGSRKGAGEGFGGTTAGKRKRVNVAPYTKRSQKGFQSPPVCREEGGKRRAVYGVKLRQASVGQKLTNHRRGR